MRLRIPKPPGLGIAKNFGREVMNYGVNVPKGIGALGGAIARDEYNSIVRGKQTYGGVNILKNSALTALRDTERLIPSPSQSHLPRFMQGGLVFSPSGMPHWAGAKEMQRVKGNDWARSKEFVTHEPLTALLTGASLGLPVASKFAASRYTPAASERIVRAAERLEKPTRPFVATNAFAQPVPVGRFSRVLAMHR